MIVAYLLLTLCGLNIKAHPPAPPPMLAVIICHQLVVCKFEQVLNWWFFPVSSTVPFTEAPILFPSLLLCVFVCFAIW